MVGIFSSVKQVIGKFSLISIFLVIACSSNSPSPPQQASPVSSEIYRLSERQLTSEELKQVLSQLDQDIDQTLNNQIFGSLYQDRRTAQQKEEINAYIQSWASIDPDIAPFLGRRQIIENTLIYPSLQKGKVCILQQYTVEPSEKGVLFNLGEIRNGLIQTSGNQTIIARNDLLAVLSIKNNKPQFSLLPHALPLVEPELNQIPEIQKQYNESQCQFASP